MRLRKLFGLMPILLFLPSAMVSFGCSDSDIRVVHASPDTQAVDVFLVESDDTSHILLFSNLTYTGTSPVESQRHTGNFHFIVVPTGAGRSATPLLSSPDFTLNHGDKITALLVGSSMPTSTSSGLTMIVVKDSFGSSKTGTARVRVVNASPDAPDLAVDIDNGAVVVPSVSRFQVATTDSAVVAGKPVQVAVSTAGTNQPITAFTTTAGDRDELFLVITGFTASVPREGNALNLLLVGNTGSAALVRQNPIFYWVDASPDVPSIDLFNGATEIASNITFGQVASPIQVAPDSDLIVDVFAHSTSTTRPSGSPLASTNLKRAAGERYLVVAAGFGTQGRSPGFQTAIYTESFDLTSTEPALRTIQASPDLPSMDMGTIGSGPFVPISAFQGMQFLTSSSAAGTAVPQTFTLGVAPANTKTAVAEFNLHLAPGARDFGVTSGAAIPHGSDQPLQLILIDTTQRPWTSTRIPNSK